MMSQITANSRLFSLDLTTKNRTSGAQYYWSLVKGVHWSQVDPLVMHKAFPSHSIILTSRLVYISFEIFYNNKIYISKHSTLSGFPSPKHDCQRYISVRSWIICGGSFRWGPLSLNTARSIHGNIYFALVPLSDETCSIYNELELVNWFKQWLGAGEYVILSIFLLEVIPYPCLHFTAFYWGSWSMLHLVYLY